jgi:hypothetical protein
MQNSSDDEAGGGKGMQPVIVFPFRLPKAGAVAIQRALHTTDGASRGHVSRTSALREELVAALTPAGGGQVSTALVLQKAERYLPSLCGLACALTNQPRLHLNEPLNFKWTSSLRKTKHKTTGSRKMYLDWDFKFELVMTLNVRPPPLGALQSPRPERVSCVRWCVSVV